jgi:hypothetical protein
MTSLETILESNKPHANAAELLEAFQKLEEVLGKAPERAHAVPVPWETALLAQFVDVAVKEKLWLVADHLLTNLAKRGTLTREQKRLATRVRNLKATMFVQVAQIEPASAIGQAIARYVTELRPRVILDVGAATGLGTTRTFSEAAAAGGLSECVIYAMESEPVTFELLQKNTVGMSNVRPVFAALVTDLDVPTWEEIRAEMAVRSKVFAEYPEEEIEQWYRHGVALLKKLREEGRAPWKQAPAEIDIAMIDADLFFAREELSAVRERTKLVILDDVHAFKNAYNHEMLGGSQEWEMVAHEPADRHGWSAFRRR